MPDAKGLACGTGYTLLRYSPMKPTAKRASATIQTIGDLAKEAKSIPIG